MQLKTFAHHERTSLTLFTVLIASGVSVTGVHTGREHPPRRRHVQVLTVQEARSLAHARLPPAAALLLQRWLQMANPGGRSVAEMLHKNETTSLLFPLLESRANWCGVLPSLQQSD
jgi:hypothetical protein